MGIPLLLSFLEPICNKANSLKQLHTKILVVDALLLLHKKYLGKLHYGANVINDDDNDITHIDIFLNYTCGLLERGIFPIYVFDSKSPIEKENTIISRKHKLSNFANDIADDNSQERKKKHTIEYSKIQECIEFLKNIGMTVVNSIGEADADCAKIANMCKKYTCSVVSNDSDILLYNCQSMIEISFGDNKKSVNKHSEITYNEYLMKDIINFLDRKSNFYREINSNFSNKQYIEFTHKNFVDFSIMLGSDYFYNHKKPNGVYLEYEDGTIKQCNVKHVEKLFKLFSLCDYDVIKVVEYINNMKEYNEFDENEKFKFTILPTFMEIWNKTKAIYSNPITTYISPNIFEQYGFFNFTSMGKYFGNMNEKYKTNVVDKLLKINIGIKYFKSINSQTEYNSWLSYRIKYNEKRARKIKDSYSQNSHLEQKLYSIFDSINTLIEPKNDWIIVGK